MNQNIDILIKEHRRLLDQIVKLLNDINNELYTKKNSFLMNHTIGQHFRHIYDFYYQFFECLNVGDIDYDARSRIHKLETDHIVMMKSFSQIKENLNFKNNKRLNVCYQLDNNKIRNSIDSNIERELLFIHSHTLHHLAMIRGVLESKYKFQFNNDFGFSLSTLLDKEKNNRV